MPLLEIKQNLFDSPKGSILVHAVNSYGVMGAGIARTFKDLFPTNFKMYQEECSKSKTTGRCLLYQDSGYWIANLVTSSGYGRLADTTKEITKNTVKALIEFESKIKTGNLPVNIFSNKFNSGIFGVPWEITQVFLQEFTNSVPEISWTVCDYTP